MRPIHVKINSVVITSIVIILLIASGPAQALTLGINISDSEYTRGQTINLLLSADITKDEFTNIQKFTFTLKGTNTFNCEFDLNGTEISSCPGISIENIEKPDFNFGYGYGYGYGPNEGVLRYNVTISTENINAGKYETLFLVSVPGEDMEIEGQEITIANKTNEVNSCSLRAKGGSATFNETDIGHKGKLSLFIPSKGAENGKGSIIAKEGKNRVTYNFNILEASFINEKTVLIKTTGEVKVDRQGKTKETAEIIYDTESGLIDVKGTLLNIEDMDVTFSKCSYRITDISIISENYGRTDCSSSNNWCSGADLNRDGKVSIGDIVIFQENQS